MTGHDDELPEVMRQAARDYNQPPELSAADLDDLWSGIERDAFTGSREAADIQHRMPRHSRWFSAGSLARLAAVLVLGVAIGRFSAGPAASDAPPQIASAAADSLAIPEPYQTTTSRYLGQTAALLATLPGEVRAGRADERFMGRAHDLLLTTRLLLDSPAAADPRVRTLLDDLELVLAQIVRLQTDQSDSELDLIRQALEQRDVLPRLRNAVADISADD